MFVVDFFVGGEFNNLLVIEEIDLLSVVIVDMLLLFEGKLLVIVGGCL